MSVHKVFQSKVYLNRQAKDHLGVDDGDLVVVRLVVDGDTPGVLLQKFRKKLIPVRELVTVG